MPNWEALTTNLSIFTTLQIKEKFCRAAFLYRKVASLMRSFTRISPSPQGTTTLTFPKHTVTFILFSSGRRNNRASLSAWAESPPPKA
nr:unnamed protein product [Callosobruchus analis]